MQNSRNSKTELLDRIEKLVNSGGNDWQTLLRQSQGDFVPLTYNAAQFVAAQAIQNYKVVSNIWGRGTGKTTSLGDTCRQMKNSMPRAVGAFVAPSYQFFLTRIIPSLVQGLEMQGLYQNLHYFIGRRPPASWRWELPYQPPHRFDHFVIFHNGFGFHLVSQDVPGDGRGLNLDFVLTDESALLDKIMLDETVMPALRGSKKNAFAHSPFFGLQVHHTSMPLTQRGQWLFDLEAEQLISPATIKTIKANALINRDNLMPGYLQERRKTTLPWMFNAEYLNIRPQQQENGFYSLLNESKHGYGGSYNYNHLTTIGQSVDSRGDADCDTNRHLSLGIDWGTVINSLAICQHEQHREIRALKSMYVLGENMETQDDLADAFLKYYAYHTNKVAFLHYDRSGNIGTGQVRETRAIQFANRLRRGGWRVQPMSRGNKNPEHERKRMIWERVLAEDDPRLPRFRINVINARDLFISMQNAGVKRSSATNQIQKDKSKERAGNKMRQHATDLSDAVDMVVFDLLSKQVR